MTEIPAQLRALMSRKDRLFNAARRQVDSAWKGFREWERKTTIAWDGDSITIREPYPCPEHPDTVTARCNAELAAFRSEVSKMDIPEPWKILI